MTDLRKAAKEVLWAFQCHIEQTWPTDRSTAAIAALRAALVQQDEPVTKDMKSAVRWAPSSAYWSQQLRGLFGPDAREGIDALERRLAEAQQDEPLQEPVAWIDALKDAFFEGFTSVATYNDTLLNSPEEAWENYKPPRAAPPQRKPLTEEVAALTAQRDALLEALKDATKTIEHLGYPLAAIERARAAIKAMEETK